MHGNTNKKIYFEISLIVRDEIHYTVMPDKKLQKVACFGQ